MIGGQGSQSSLGVKTEATPGVGEDSAIFLPIKSESFSAAQGIVPSESIVGDSMLQSAGLDIQEATGGVEMEFDGAASGQMLYYWNGPEGYTHATWAHGGVSSVTLGTTSGGSKAAGVYKIRASSVYQSTYDGRKYHCPASAQASVTVSTDQTITISWSAPTVPTGYTLLGTIIWCSVVDGADNTSHFHKYVSGSGTSTTLTGSETPDTSVAYYTSTIVKHTFIGSVSSGGDRLEAFSTTINKNIAESERYVWCMANELKISAASPKDKMAFSVSVVAQKAEPVANEVPSFVPLQPFMGWAGATFINGVKDCTIESFEFTISNNCEQLLAICSEPYPRAVISGNRGPGSGTLTRQHEDLTFWKRMLNATEFAMKFWCFGQPVVPAGSTLNLATHGVDATPLRYRLEIDFPRCLASGDSSPIQGPGPIKETLNFTPMKDLSEATEVKFTLYNTTTAYS